MSCSSGPDLTWSVGARWEGAWIVSLRLIVLEVKRQFSVNFVRDSSGWVYSKVVVVRENRFRQTEMIPCLMAYCTSSALDLICNRSITVYLCSATVYFVIFSVSATCFMESPSASN
jgi:hypothetical protein